MSNNNYNKSGDIPPLNGSLFSAVLPTAITISAVALIESLGTVRLVGEMGESTSSSTSSSSSTSTIDGRGKKPADLRAESIW
jgi:hypothetical protein